MSVTYYDSTIPVFVRSFEQLVKVLKKTEEFAKENGKTEEEILNLRIFPDMLPLTFQLQIMVGMCINLLHYGAKLEKPDYTPKEKSFADMYATVDMIVGILKATPTTVFDGKLDGNVQFWYPGSQLMEMSGKSFIIDYIIPNFHFHFTTLYDLVRSIGVPVGKMDYLGDVVTFKGPGPLANVAH